jgi:enoyl-CoA hydratase/carnithine racemase
MAADDLLLDRDGRVALVTFNRPEARNAMTFEMYERLYDLCGELDHDSSVGPSCCGARARRPS